MSFHSGAQLQGGQCRHLPTHVLDPYVLSHATFFFAYLVLATQLFKVLSALE